MSNRLRHTGVTPAMRLLWMVLAAGAAMYGQQTVSSDCSVQGTTTNAITGEFVPRAQITLSGPNVSATTTADNSGIWSFAGVNCGTMQISATRPGFVTPATQIATLASGAVEKSVVIRMMPHAVITGRVQDEQADPLQGAHLTVLVSRVVQGRRAFQQVASVTTNDLGEYRIAGLSPGRAILCAGGPEPVGGRAEESNGDRCYPGPVEGGSASTMPLLAGHDSHVDFTLPRVHLVHVTGTVTGMPANMRAALMLVKRAGSVAGVTSKAASVRPDGTFDFSGVLPGSYTISSDYFDSGKRLTARVPVEVSSSGAEGVSVHLEAGFSLTANVTVQSASGASTAGKAMSFLLRSADPTLGGGTIQWNKDHTVLTVNEMPAGAYTLEASVPAPFFVKSAIVAGHDMAREPVQISQSPGVVEVVLSDDSGTLEGTVSDANDQPAAATVMILQSGRSPRVATAGASGHFSVAGLAPGEYSAYAWEDSRDVEYANPEWLRHYSATTVSVPASQTAQVQLKRLGVTSQ